jgi:hydrogenase maturation protease
LWWNSTGRKTESSTEGQEKKIIILGVGNLLLSDEGVGVHVAQKLMDTTFPPEVEVVEGGTDGFGLINILLRADHLILIDAVKGGGKAGSIYRFNLEECRPFPDIYKTSVHQISILEVINLSGLIGPPPRTTVIGIEPKCLQMGMELSPEIESQIPKVISLVKKEVQAALDSRRKVRQ